MITRTLFLLLKWNAWLLVCSTAFSVHDVLNYKELEDLGSACPPYDTCKNLTGRKNCGCNSTCALHGTCCIDSLHIDPLKKKGKCNERHKIYMVALCDSKWTGDDVIRKQCEDDQVNERDPLSITPMTNAVSGYTYKNHFCALCNDDIDDAVFWESDISASVSLNRDQILDNLRFNEQSGKWESLIKENIVDISIHFTVPNSIFYLLEYCDFDLISECAETWQDLEVKMKCEAYEASIWISNLNFRNIHCALCNYQNVNDSKCPYSGAGYGSGEYGGWHGGGPNYKSLFYVRNIYGNEAGKSPLCPANEVADFFYGRKRNCSDDSNRRCKYKCRKYRCPEHLRQDKTCVPGKSE